MSQIQARATIPIAWGEQARCPACSAPDMEVQHQSSGPDQLRCTACGLRFELQLDGPQLRVTHWPDLQAPDSVPAPGSWLTIDELRSRLRRPSPDDSPPAPTPAASAAAPAPTRPGQPAGPSAPVPASNEKVARVKKLLDLGSTPMEVRASLAREGVPAEQIQAALTAANQMIRGQQARQVRKMWGWLVLAAVLLALVLWGGLRLQRAIAGRQAEMAAALKSTLMPNLVQALGVTTPVVQQLPDPPSASSGTPIPCPATPEQAASLFGGRASSWSKGPNGWIRIDSSGENATIHIPYGMLAAYFKVGNPMELVEVQGPAVLSQVPSLAVSCP